MKILYTGAFRFPDQDAAAKRVLANAFILKNLGHQVTFAGWEDKEREIDLQGMSYAYEGFDYESQAEFRIIGKSNVIYRLFGFLFRGRKTINWLEKNNKFDIIITYNPTSYFALKLISFAKKNRVKLILDSTEWYESSHLVGGKYGLASIENYVRMHCIYPKFKCFIVISKYLEKYFSKSDNVVINVPPLLIKPEDIRERKVELVEKIRIIYAGSPGLKDNIYSLISLLPLLNKKSNITIVIRLIGPDVQMLKKQMKVLNIDFKLVSPFLEVYGRVPMNEVRGHYYESDFSFIFRENKRYAEAGFPTKFVESISYGVPVISSKVGDIQNYITNFDVGFLIDEKNIFDDINLIINKFIGTKGYRDTIKKNCYSLAENKFSINSHEDNLAKIL